MNYNKHYTLLIEKARTQQTNNCTEQHHIIPKCVGGTNDSSNLVMLTPEQHLLAHLLLAKINPENVKLLYAANMMSTDKDGTRINNKRYGWIRRRLVIMSSGENNHMYGKRHSDETKEKISTRSKNSFLGKRHSLDTKKKISEKNRGKPGLSGEKNGMFGKRHSDDTKKKISNNSPFKGTAGTGKHPSCGRVMSTEQKEKYKKLFTGRRLPEELRALLRKPKGPQQKLTCTTCGISGGASNMKRYHFDNCKENK